MKIYIIDWIWPCYHIKDNIYKEYDCINPDRCMIYEAIEWYRERDDVDEESMDNYIDIKDILDEITEEEAKEMCYDQYECIHWSPR